MNNKITFPELVEKLADSTNSSKRVCELFLKELFATISQELIDGKNVKVKKLGTFKLAKVNARKSIDVNTGEEIEIPVHNKLIFVPDNSLADAINTPFVNFETTVLSDDITDDDLKAVDNADEVEDEPEKVEDNNDYEESSEEEDNTQPEAFIISPPPFKIADEEAPATEPIEEETPATEAAEEEAPASDDQPTPPPFNKEEPVEQEQPVEQDEQPVEQEEQPVEQEEQPVEEQPVEQEEQPVEEQPVEQEEQPVEEQPVEQAPQSVEQENPEIEQPAETQPADDNEDDGFVSPQYYANYEIEEKVQEASKKAMLKGFLWGVIVTVAACAVVGYVVYSNMSKG